MKVLLGRGIYLEEQDAKESVPKVEMTLLKVRRQPCE